MLGVVMPVWLTDVDVLWESTIKAIRSVDVPSRVYVVPNRLSRCETLGEFEQDLRKVTGRTNEELVVLPCDGARSVAASWNQGIRMAQRDGCDRFLVMANDCYWSPGSIAKLIAFMERPESSNVFAASGYCHKDGPRLTEPTDACDFTGFLIRGECIEQVGWFDEKFRPAYFEDNDMVTRIVLSGHDCRVVPEAMFDTPGSLTARSCPEAAHHVAYWFEKNRQRYKAKWGTDRVPVDSQDCLERCFKHPWNSSKYPLSFWDRD